jgi:hypothetical protein
MEVSTFTPFPTLQMGKLSLREQGELPDATLLMKTYNNETVPKAKRGQETCPYPDCHRSAVGPVSYASVVLNVQEGHFIQTVVQQTCSEHSLTEAKWPTVPIQDPAFLPNVRPETGYSNFSLLVGKWRMP